MVEEAYTPAVKDRLRAAGVVYEDEAALLEERAEAPLAPPPADWVREQLAGLRRQHGLPAPSEGFVRDAVRRVSGRSL